MIGYLVNVYPKVSHAFIRREILALESLGTSVRRYSVRQSEEALVDPADQAEAGKTEFLLDQKGRLLWDACLTLSSSPLKALAGLSMAWQLAPGGVGPLIRQMIYLLEAAALLRRCRRDGVTHLHAHFGTNPAAVALLCHVLGGPTYSFTVHGPDEFDAPLALRLGLKVQHSKFHVVRCGVDETFLEGELTPPPSEPRFVCVARLSEQKGLPVLIEAVALLRDQGTACTVELIGDGPLRGMLEAMVRERGLTDRIHFRGNQPSHEVRRSLLNARALVLPSFAEGLPVVLMEALALGRPAITTQIAGIPELIRPGETGWLVPAGDAEALAEAMVRASELSLCQSLGRACISKQHSAHGEAVRIRDLVQMGPRRS
jgi:glycosyltransferase involved in cell wall biosynthesis